MFLPISAHVPPSGIMRRVARLGCSLARERIVGGFCRPIAASGRCRASSSVTGATMRRRMPFSGAGLTGVRAARAFRLGIVADGAGAAIAAWAARLGGPAARGRVRAAGVTSRGAAACGFGDAGAVIRPRQRAAAERPAAYRRRSSARLSGWPAGLRGMRGRRGLAGASAACPPSLFGGLSRARLARRGVRRLRLALGGRQRFCAARFTGGAASVLPFWALNFWPGSDSACSSLCFALLPQNFFSARTFAQFQTDALMQAPFGI